MDVLIQHVTIVFMLKNYQQAPMIHDSSTVQFMVLHFAYHHIALNLFAVPMNNESEARLQQECYIWYHNTYPHLRKLFFKIKNEGTNRITGARDKATGLISGVADSCLLHHVTACFIEFKTETGKQSPAQREWQLIVEQAGFKYCIIRTKTQFIELCHELGL